MDAAVLKQWIEEAEAAMSAEGVKHAVRVKQLIALLEVRDGQHATELVETHTKHRAKLKALKEALTERVKEHELEKDAAARVREQLANTERRCEELEEELARLESAEGLTDDPTDPDVVPMEEAPEEEPVDEKPKPKGRKKG